MDGNIWPSETYQKILQWVKRGGVFIIPEDIGKLWDINRNEKYDNLLFAKQKNSLGGGKTIRFSSKGGNYLAFCRFIGEITGINPAPQNFIYSTQFKDGAELIYDAGNSTIREKPPANSAFQKLE